MTPVGKLALIKTFDKSELLKAMNFAINPALIGTVLGPLVVGYMVDYLSWHWIFLINIPIGILGIVLGLKFMPDYKSDDVDFDFKGFLIFAAASLLLSVSLELFGDMQNITPVLIVFILGFLFLYYYYKHAKKEGHPIFPLNLFQVSRGNYFFVRYFSENKYDLILFKCDNDFRNFRLMIFSAKETPLPPRGPVPARIIFLTMVESSSSSS